MLVAPFAVLLGSIALMPFINAKVWHDHFPDFAFFLGSMVAAFYAVEMGAGGRGAMVHALVEYLLVHRAGGGAVRGGRGNADRHSRAGEGRSSNAVILLVRGGAGERGGDDGASSAAGDPAVHAVRTRGRLRALHVVVFIFIVSQLRGVPDADRGPAAVPGIS
jgi:hypothetical protein